MAALSFTKCIIIISDKVTTKHNLENIELIWLSLDTSKTNMTLLPDNGFIKIVKTNTET